MTRCTIEAVECDRCGEAIQFDDEDSPEKVRWSQAQARTLAGASLFMVKGERQECVDLCADCTEDLRLFVEGCSLVNAVERQAKRDRK